MQWRFYIDDTEYSEPGGFADIVFWVKRDPKYHGVFFEATLSELTWYGDAATYLQGLYDASGLKASAELEIQYRCDTGDYATALTGNFDFRTFKKNCGNTCSVSMAIEKAGCTMILQNRADQKVDIDSTTAFDKMTNLQQYSGLNFDLTLPGIELSTIDEAELSEAVSDDFATLPEWVDNIAPQGMNAYISPCFDTIVWESLGEFNASVFPQFYNGGANNRPPYEDMPPTVNFTTAAGVQIECDYSNVLLEFKISGTVEQAESTPTANTFLTIKLFKLAAGADGSDLASWTELYDNPFMSLSGTETEIFDIEDSISMPIEAGEKIWFGIFILVNDADTISVFEWTQNAGDYLRITASATCPDTETAAYMVNETGSRIVEAITDGCLRLKSDYYGRTDSQPIASSEDGCGSLRVLTSGLKIRNAENDKFFLSWLEYFNGLRAIDNIGFGIETDEIIPTRQWVRLEPVEYFYSNTKILDLPYVPRAVFSVDPDRYYSVVKIGYDKWEVERFNGLDEYNSNKEFRTGLSTISNTLEAQSNFVAGGYAIETTRLQSFAKTGAADTTYDNETFIICVDRVGSYADPYVYNDGYIVETGNITSSANIYSPATSYNWRIRPWYNLMRWAKSVLNSYANINNADSRLYFQSGTGNITATGMLTDGCILENGAKAENKDLLRTDFADADDYTPIWKPEKINISNYPVSIADYNTIVSNPYGYLNVQCGKSDYIKAYILSIQYRPAKGTAEFELLVKWQ